MASVAQPVHVALARTHQQNCGLSCHPLMGRCAVLASSATQSVKTCTANIARMLWGNGEQLQFAICSTSAI